MTLRIAKEREVLETRLSELEGVRRRFVTELYHKVFPMEVLPLSDADAGAEGQSCTVQPVQSTPQYSSQLVGPLGVAIIHRFHCIIRPPQYSSQLVGPLGVAIIHRFHCIIRPPQYSSQLVGS